MNRVCYERTEAVEMSRDERVRVKLEAHVRKINREIRRLERGERGGDPKELVALGRELWPEGARV